VVSVDAVLGVHGQDANPHLWYLTPRLAVVAGAISSALARADPAGAPLFAADAARFVGSLQPVLDTISTIKARYGGAPVAYTERVPGYLLDAAGLSVTSPEAFARAVEAGNDPSPQAVQQMETLLRTKAVKVLLYNSQATSPVTEHVQALARQAGVPVVGVSETIPKGEQSFQSWQLHQATALLQALGG
jgi:zinc/manganese transport system substrate-binding protein